MVGGMFIDVGVIVGCYFEIVKCVVIGYVGGKFIIVVGII